jgi:hypothetical protein
MAMRPFEPLSRIVHALGRLHKVPTGCMEIWRFGLQPQAQRRWQAVTARALFLHTALTPRPLRVIFDREEGSSRSRHVGCPRKRK